MDSVKTLSSSKAYSIDELCSDIRTGRVRRIVVMTGAGISTASGIPDFRSPKTGLYSNLGAHNLPYPEALFEKSHFRQDPKPFFSLAKEIIPNCEKFKPNRIHYFLRLLQDKNLLHRLYTQNIDGLECLSGIKGKFLVEAHGSFRTAKCTMCRSKYSGLYFKNECLANKIPRCKLDRCNGVIKPDIVFFEEDLPDAFYKLNDRDFMLADCVIVMGTSLEVEPFASLIKKSRTNVPRLLMNRNSVGPFRTNRPALGQPFRKDLQLLGDLLNCVEFLVDRLDWKSDFEELVTNEMKLMEVNPGLILETNYYKFESNNEKYEHEVTRPRYPSSKSLDRRKVIQPIKTTTSQNQKRSETRLSRRRITTKETLTTSESESDSSSTSDDSELERNRTLKHQASKDETKLIQKFEFNLNLNRPFQMEYPINRKINSNMLNTKINMVNDRNDKSEEINRNNKPNIQTYFYGKRLMTANSKPLLAKEALLKLI